MIFYWILLAILVGVGIAFMVNSNLEVGEIKGVWALSYVRAAQEAETDLLFIDSQAIKTAQEVDTELIAKMFSEDLGCGQLGLVSLWNKKDQFCSLKVEEKFAREFNSKMSQAGFLTYDLSVKEGELRGKSNEVKMIGIENPAVLLTEQKSAGLFTRYDAYLTRPFYLKYSYGPSFRVKVDLSLPLYSQLEQQAKLVVYQCQNELELKSCLDKNKPKEWKYSSCSQEQFSPVERKVPFCVEVRGQKVNFGLDLSSQKVFSPKQVTVNQVDNLIEVQFENVPEAESYDLYYTNLLPTEDLPASANQIFFASQGDYFYQKVSLINPSHEECPEEKEAGTVYLCGNRVKYFFTDQKLVSGSEYYFGVTSTKRGEESLIYNIKELFLNS